MRFRDYFLIILVATFFLSCKQNEDISGKVVGIWETDWIEDLSGDLDEMTVNEVIAFDSTGVFQQVFSGNVEYDDWDNQTDVAYIVVVGGKWQIVKPDNIVLQYDMNQFEIEIGNVTIDADYTDAAIGLLTGDWGDVLSGIIKGNNTDKISKKVEAEVNKQVSKYFKDLFRVMNKDKKSFSSVEISPGTLTAKVNRGFMGSTVVYDKMIPSHATNSMVSNKPSKSQSSTVESSHGSRSQIKSYKSNYNADAKEDWIVEFEGSIGKYPVKMYLNLKNIDNYDWCEVEGKYCYTSSGSGSYLYLSGVRQGDSMKLSEYNDKGEITGTFEGSFNIYGNLSSIEYTGTFTNYKGKTFNFSLRYE